MPCWCPEVTTLPFDGLFRPLGQAAAMGLDALPGVAEGWRMAAIRGLADHLAERFAAIAAPLVFQLFETRRPPLPAAALLLDRPPAGTSSAAHDAFIAGLIAGGWQAVCARHPVLASRLDRVAADGRAAAADLLRAFAADRDRLAPLTGPAPDITSITFGLSDPHGHGRGVARVDLADGRALAFKPRGLAPEAGFFTLLGWLDERMSAGQRCRLPPQHCPAIIDCGSHGWMAWVERAPCADTAEVEAFHRRLGGLAALLDLLGANDVHSDNLIAAGATPVVVDLECLFGLAAASPALDRLEATPALLTTGLLPFLVPLPGGASHRGGLWRNMGCLGPVLPAATVPDNGWCHIGTDWIRRATVAVPVEDPCHPLLDGREADVTPWVPALVDGYDAAMEVLIAHRDALAAADGPLAFTGALCRHVALPTESYRRLLVRLAEPDLADAPEAPAAQAARIAHRPPQPGIDAGLWPGLLAAEARALARLDVPAFRFDPADGRLSEADGSPIGRLAPPPRARIIAKARALSDGDRRRAGGMLGQVLAPVRPAAADYQGLAAHLVATALPRRDGGIDWIRPHERPPIAWRPAGHGLYHGSPGIALALAQAGRLAGRPDWLDAARAALLPLRRFIADPGADNALAAFGPGYADGLGGMIAGLVWAAELLDDPALIDDASRLARTADPDDGTASLPFDLHDGLAGLVVALAFLHSRAPSAALARQLRRQADRLTAMATTDGDALIWRPARGPVLAGLAHGQSGMAVALAAAGAVTDTPVLIDAARRALTAEDRLFDPARANWPSPDGGRRPATAWCHGAAGIALARLALLNLAPDIFADRRAELDTALATTAGAPSSGAGDLCCGDAGRRIILIRAGRTVPGPLCGPPVLWSDAPPLAAPDPCLFKGLAGLCHADALAHGGPQTSCFLLPFG